MDEPTKPPIDRELVTRDLARLATLLGPAIESRLEMVRLYRLGPIPVGEAIYRQLQGLPARMTFDAMSRVLSLSDAELVALVDVAGLELGAWRGFTPPATAEQLAAAAPAWEGLLGALDDPG